MVDVQRYEPVAETEHIFPFLKTKGLRNQRVNSLFVIHISLFRDRLRLENQLIWADRRTVTTVGATNHTKTIAGPRPQLSAFGQQTEAVKDRGLYPSSCIVHQAVKNQAGTHKRSN